MIEPEVASRWRSQAAFDRTAAVLIGLVAIIAAVLAIQQSHAGMAGTRAQVQGARLAADAAAHINANSVSNTAAVAAQQQAVLASLEGIARQLAGTMAGDDAAVAVGTARAAAADRLRVIMAATTATSGGPPVDHYAADLLAAQEADLRKQVAEQGRQVDLAAAEGTKEMRAVMGLSLVTLAGVLAGVSAVLGRGRAGWAVLATAWLVAGGAAAVAIGGML